MTHFRDTPDGADFIASADSRETSPEVMQAIAFFAHDLPEAERLWQDGPDSVICHPIDLWEHITRNGLRDPAEYFWGAAGNHWWDDMRPAE
jgi:hypothetical protein